MYPAGEGRREAVKRRTSKPFEGQMQEYPLFAWANDSTWDIPLQVDLVTRALSYRLRIIDGWIWKRLLLSPKPPTDNASNVAGPFDA
jgi:hypothetical protein